MQIVMSYKTDSERETIIQDMAASGYILTGDNHHFEGKSLVFSQPDDILITDLRAKVVTLEAQLVSEKARIKEIEERVYDKSRDATTPS